MCTCPVRLQREYRGLPSRVREDCVMGVMTLKAVKGVLITKRNVLLTTWQHDKQIA